MTTKTHLMLIEVNMGKPSNAQPLFELPLSADIVLAKGRFLHCCNESYNGIYDRILKKTAY